VKGCVFLIGGVCSSNAINGQRTSIAVAYVIFFFKKKKQLLLLSLLLLLFEWLKK
jgi:hypothetical protein